MEDLDVIAAHEHCNCHRREVEASDFCGCFFCLSIFEPERIKRWLKHQDEPEETGCAICPECGIDSVIGSASGYPINREFLQRMHAQWFR
jgi:hypothetical protein